MKTGTVKEKGFLATFFGTLINNEIEDEDEKFDKVDVDLRNELISSEKRISNMSKFFNIQNFESFEETKNKLKRNVRKGPKIEMPKQQEESKIKERGEAER